MKSYTFFLLMAGLFLFSSTTSAQPKPAIKAGANYGGLSGYTNGKKASFHTGISLQWAMNKKWKVQPELLYTSKAQGYTVEENEMVVNKTLSMSYAALPVMLQYFASTKFYIEAGPQLSFLLGVKDKGSSGAKTDVKRNLSNTQFAMNAGIGLLLKDKAGVYLRYSAGLTDITMYDADTDCSRIVQAGVFFRIK